MAKNILRGIGLIGGVLVGGAISPMDDRNSQFPYVLIGALVGLALVTIVDYLLPKNILPNS